MSAGSHRISYRPDVDGLRAVAVLGVVLFHAGLGMPGGYAGVDVFFVISGFLITSLILKDLRAGSFSFLDFWERRARRILPALSVVVLATLVVGWFLMLPSDYQGLARSAIALTLFSSNVLFWRETGYFRPAAEEKPLLHTWSLSVEEQFYLLIPILLVLLYRFGRSSWIFFVLVAGAAGSFVLATIGLEHSSSATFFLLPTRAWELAAGSLLAFAQPVRSDRVRGVMTWTGLAAVLLPFLLYTADTAFPGPSALPPVLGAALIIWSGIGSNETRKMPIVSQLLASPPLVWIGLLSYSLYLWHWPVFAYYRYLYSVPPGFIESILFVGLSFGLAWLSLRFVERPFRSRAAISSRKLIFGMSGSTVATVLFLSLILWRSGGVPQRLSPEVIEITAATTDDTFMVDMDLDDVPEGMIQIGIPNTPPEVIVWGDSHAMAILPGVDAACRKMGVNGVAATSSATAPVLEWFMRHRHGLSEDAPAFNRAVMDYIQEAARDGSLRHVILAARWRVYLRKDDSHPGLEAALAATIRDIREAGCEVIILKEVPTFPRDVPRSLALHQMVGWDSLVPVLETGLHSEESHAEELVFENLRREFGAGVHVVDPLPFLVERDEYIEPMDDAGRPLYRDDNHLSVIGSLRLQDAFAAIFGPVARGDISNNSAADEIALPPGPG